MDDVTKTKNFRIIIGSVLVVALLVITIIQFMKYLDEDTIFSVKYERKYWIELPSITVCTDDDARNYDQTNMTFEEFAKILDETQLNLIESANLSYVNPAFEKYV